MAVSTERFAFFFRPKGRFLRYPSHPITIPNEYHDLLRSMCLPLEPAECPVRVLDKKHFEIRASVVLRHLHFGHYMYLEMNADDTENWTPRPPHGKKLIQVEIFREESGLCVLLNCSGRSANSQLPSITNEIYFNDDLPASGPDHLQEILQESPLYGNRQPDLFCKGDRIGQIFSDDDGDEENEREGGDLHPDERAILERMEQADSQPTAEGYFSLINAPPKVPALPRSFEGLSKDAVIGFAFKGINWSEIPVELLSQKPHKVEIGVATLIGQVIAEARHHLPGNILTFSACFSFVEESIPALLRIVSDISFHGRLCIETRGAEEKIVLKKVLEISRYSHEEVNSIISCLVEETEQIASKIGEYIG